jgi:beta-glucosidase-like glycosyl hydrolase
VFALATRGAGVPALLQPDATLGITNPSYRPGHAATALPAALAMGASSNPALARAAGAMLGREMRVPVFNSANVPQLYLTEACGEKRMRLIGFQRVTL